MTTSPALPPIDVFTAPPACVTLLALACLDVAALLELPPEQLIIAARNRLRLPPERGASASLQPVSAQRLADDLADAIRWIARNPGGSAPDRLIRQRDEHARALLDYAHRLELAGRPVPYLGEAPTPPIGGE